MASYTSGFERMSLFTLKIFMLRPTFSRFKLAAIVFPFNICINHMYIYHIRSAEY